MYRHRDLCSAPKLTIELQSAPVETLKWIPRLTGGYRNAMYQRPACVEKVRVKQQRSRSISIPVRAAEYSRRHLYRARKISGREKHDKNTEARRSQMTPAKPTVRFRYHLPKSGQSRRVAR